MDFVRQAINNIAQTAKNKFNDNEGFFQKGKFTAQPIQQAVSSPANISYTAQRLGLTPNFTQGMNRQQFTSTYNQGTSQIMNQFAKLPRPVQKFGEGFYESNTMGLSDLNVPKSRNLGETATYGAGYVAGMFNPLNPMNKLAGVLKGTKLIGGAQQALGQTAGKLMAKGGFNKLLGTGVANLSQGLPYTTAYGLVNSATQKPEEAGKSVATDLGFDALLGMVPVVGSVMVGSGAGKEIKKAGKKALLDVDVKEVRDIGRMIENNFTYKGKMFNPKAKEMVEQSLDRYNVGKKIAYTEDWKKLDVNGKYKKVVEFILDKGRANEIEVLPSSRSYIDEMGNVVRPNRPTRLLENDPKLRNLSGGIAGVEMYQDENGKWQTRYNPVKGIAGVVGMTATSKMGGKDIQEKLNMARQNLQASPQIESIIQEGRKSIGKPADKSGKGIRQIANELYTQWVDRFHPISQASSQAKKQLKAKGAVLRPEYDPEALVRRLTGAGGIADTQYRTELKPVIDKLEQFGISKDDMDVYLAHKRMAGFGDVGREIYGADPVKSQNIINAIEAKYGESIKSVADELYLYQDKGLKELADSGFLSPEALQAIKSQNPNYSPLYRVMDEMDNYLGVPTRKTMQGANPIEKIKGSDRQITSPVESIIANTFRNRSAIEKNRVAQSIIRLQEMAPELGFRKVDKSAGNTITVWNQGKKEFWEVGEEIASTAKGLNEENMNTLLKIFTAPASLLRQGATGRNPEFMLPNIIRDQLDASITSKYGYIPFVDFVSGLKSMLTKDDIYRKWEGSGAKIDLGEMSGRKSIQASFDTIKKKKRLSDWIGKALDTMGKYSEQPTRIGLFKKAYKKTGNEMMSMMESRDATVDFARMGSKMKVANSIIPFLNVGVQGFDKLIRATKNNPAKVATLGSLYGVLPAVSATVYNIMYHPKEYEEIPQYDKDSNFVFIKGRNENGTVDYFTIPKGNVIPLIANPAEHFIAYMAGQDSESFATFATKFISSALPVVGDGSTLKEVAIKTIGGNLPQLIKPATEVLLNKSFYKYNADKAEAKEIVPSYLKNKPGYKQDYEFTPKMYKAIGAVLNVSPLQIKNTMEGYLAGYAKIPAQVIQIMSDVSEGKESSPNDVTLLRRFMKQTYETNAPKNVIEPETPSFMERITGKVSASNGNMDYLAREKRDKQAKAKYREGLTDAEKQTEDAYQTYDKKVKAYTKLDNSSLYAKAKRDTVALKLADTINENDYMNEEMKADLLKKLPINKGDIEYYQIAKDTVDMKQIYVNEQVQGLRNNGAGDQEVYKWLKENQKEVNGKSIVTATILKQLAGEGQISYAMSGALKKVTTGKVKLRAGRKVKKPKKLGKIKVSYKAPKLTKLKVKIPKLAKIKMLKPKKVKTA